MAQSVVNTLVAPFFGWPALVALSFRQTSVFAIFSTIMGVNHSLY